MTISRNIFYLLFSFVLLTACKQKKKPSLSGEEPVEVADFIEFFQPLTLPYQVSDSMLPAKEKDSLLISHKIFTQFVPDSALTDVFGKDKKLKIYPLGKAAEQKAETYLVAKIVGSAKRAVYLLVFDNKNKFMTAMPLLRSDLSKTIQRTVIIDKKFTITRNQLRRNADASLSEGKDVYVLNAGARRFTLIMTESLEDKVTELINPIDTITRKNKWSADYSSGKMNLVSIRDAKKGDRLRFFIHFEKNNGDCTGELKGEAIIKSASLAEYRLGGDPCVLQFKFTNNAVTLLEMEGCGAHRGLRCSFDGSYARKKEIKPKLPKK